MNTINEIIIPDGWSATIKNNKILLAKIEVKEYMPNDGDIIACNIDNYQLPWIGIYHKKHRTNYENTFSTYCYINASKHKFVSDPAMCHGHSYDNIRPATREEKLCLFNCMHNAGYRWDSRNRVLKSIFKKGDFIAVDIPGYSSPFIGIFSNYVKKNKFKVICCADETYFSVYDTIDSSIYVKNLRYATANEIDNLMMLIEVNGYVYYDKTHEMIKIHPGKFETYWFIDIKNDITQPFFINESVWLSTNEDVARHINKNCFLDKNACMERIHKLNECIKY